MTVLRSLYPRLGTGALSFVRRPAAVLGQWTQAAAGFTQKNALYLGPAAGGAQLALVPTFAAIPNATTHSLLLAQVCSDPLQGQRLAAGTWRVAFAARLQNAGVGYRWSGQAALFVVNGFTGGRRGVVFNRTRIGSGSRTATTEVTCLASAVSGFAVDLFTGDYLVLELGIEVTNAVGATAPVASLFADGTITIASDAAAASNARSLLLAPQDLLTSLPQTGEAPSPTVDHAAAVTLLKEHFPPHSDRLYDWDRADSVISEILALTADVIKLYGYDVMDRLLREASPLTSVELLSYWESLLGVDQSRSAEAQSAEEIRPGVLAALRSLGPLTPFNLLAALAVLAGYAPGSLPELYEFTADDLVPVYSSALTVAIPEAADFSAAVEVLTPTLLDGGVIWPTGAAVELVLSAAAGAELHVRLEAPDFRFVTWAGGGRPASTLILRSAAFAGCGAHGSWRLLLYRDVGSPVLSLTEWHLTTCGAGKGGRGERKGNWSVYFDSSHRSFSLAVARALLDKVTQAYGRSWILFDNTSIPGTATHVPGMFIPG